MTPESQRIEIAQACGWKRGTRSESSFSDPSKQIALSCWMNPDGVPHRRPPDYLNDLNAMHEAEKVLTDEQRAQFAYVLAENVLHVWPDDSTSNWFTFAHATAAQRAEAFLRTIGKWREEA